MSHELDQYSQRILDGCRGGHRIWHKDGRMPNQNVVFIDGDRCTERIPKSVVEKLESLGFLIRRTDEDKTVWYPA